MSLPTPYDCADAIRRLDDYLDRELSAEETARVREHLAVCHECVQRFRFEASVLRGLRARLRRLDVPPDLVARVRRAIAAGRGVAR